MHVVVGHVLSQAKGKRIIGVSLVLRVPRTVRSKVNRGHGCHFILRGCTDSKGHEAMVEPEWDDSRGTAVIIRVLHLLHAVARRIAGTMASSCGINDPIVVLDLEFRKKCEIHRVVACRLVDTQEELKFAEVSNSQSTDDWKVAFAHDRVEANKIGVLDVPIRTCDM